MGEQRGYGAGKIFVANNGFRYMFHSASYRSAFAYAMWDATKSMREGDREREREAIF